MSSLLPPLKSAKEVFNKSKDRATEMIQSEENGEK
jgi:hypothetical protein